MSMWDREYGIEFVRRMVRVFDACNETFNQRFSPEELLAIFRAHIQSGWDLYPDQWTGEQVRAAIQFGEVPRWDDKTERPLPPIKR